jgi:arylsulfatase A-like enzyme
MISRTVAPEKAGAPGWTPDRDAGAGRSGSGSFLLVAAWCGLVSGLLEVGAIVLRKQTVDVNQFYWSSRHFVWFVPLIDLTIFLGLGVVLSVAARLSRRRLDAFSTRVLGGLALLPPLLAAFPGIYGLAGLFLTLGIAARLAPALSRRAAGFRRLVRVSLPLVAASVIILTASLLGGDWLEARRQQARPLPPPGSPNVLLIVLDTVAADHLGLYGYHRATSRTLGELAARGVCFNDARATSSWTLPSHGSMFTGRWPHELSAGWMTPLDRTHPTVAEYLRSRGYATAGFVGNTLYCGWDSGLARGFTTYRDYSLLRPSELKAAVLVDRIAEGALAIQHFAEKWLFLDGLRVAVQPYWRLFLFDRKRADVVDREFLDWLSHDRNPDRPFFAFLNFYDAHTPYELGPSGIHRFGARPRNEHEVDLLLDWHGDFLRAPSDRVLPRLRDMYDDGVADLDEQLGWLIDQLDRRGVLEQTWVIITADHGESFGEHPGVFFHGASLYRTELHVPLVIIPPGKCPSPRVVAEPVSLRNLAATIFDVAGLQDSSPFPGESLAKFASGSPRPPGAGVVTSGPALSEVIPNRPYDEDPSHWLSRTRWPSSALADGQWTYIRREGDVREELFRIRDDAQEQQNLAGDPAMQPILRRMRAELDRLTGGPLTPDRFNP